MKKLKEYWLIILIIISLLGATFFWFEWRPMKIRANCSSNIINAAKDKSLGTSSTAADIEMLIDICLLKGGLDK